MRRALQDRYVRETWHQKRRVSPCQTWVRPLGRQRPNATEGSLKGGGSQWVASRSGPDRDRFDEPIFGLPQGGGRAGEHQGSRWCGRCCQGVDRGPSRHATPIRRFVRHVSGIGPGQRGPNGWWRKTQGPLIHQDDESGNRGAPTEHPCQAFSRKRRSSLTLRVELGCRARWAARRAVARGTRSICGSDGSARIEEGSRWPTSLSRGQTICAVPGWPWIRTHSER